jgi:hypothetical protein
MSTSKNTLVDFSTNIVQNTDPDVGMCLSCSHKLTLCGIPFTADVVCCKCNKINSFIDSRQPVFVASMDSCVFV